MKKLKLAIFLGLILAVAFSSVNSFFKECENIRRDTLRLHIMANSDSKEDQELKLEVRNEILKQKGESLKEIKSLDKAQERVKESLSEIEEIAKKVVREKGKDYPVSATLDKSYFTTRYYENFTLPAGNYNALKVTIGSGEGKNWWCVLYPPLCLPASMKDEELSEFLSEGEIELIRSENKTEYKFLLVEIFEKIKSNYLTKHRN